MTRHCLVDRDRHTDTETETGTDRGTETETDRGTETETDTYTGRKDGINKLFQNNEWTFKVIDSIAMVYLNDDKIADHNITTCVGYNRWVNYNQVSLRNSINEQFSYQ